MKLIAAKYFPVRGAKDPLSTITSMYWPHFVADRFCLLNKYSPYDVAESIPGTLPNRLDPVMMFSDIMDAKARELIAQSNEGTIAVSWSGGVDSTAVACALLKNGLPPERLHLYCINSSLVEYPRFHVDLEKQGVRITVATSETFLDVISKTDAEMIVSGWCADQLFGSNIHQKDPDQYYKPWTDGVRALLTQNNVYDPQSFEMCVPIWNDYAERLGFKLNVFCEAAWLFNFALKWTHVSRDYQLSLVSESARSKPTAFFEDIRFQNWAVANFNKLTDHHQVYDKAYYKRPLKEYIYAFNDDPDYFKHKGKHNSWAYVGIMHEGKPFMSVMDTTGVHFYQEQAENMGAQTRIDYRVPVAVAKRYLKK